MKDRRGAPHPRRPVVPVTMAGLLTLAAAGLAAPVSHADPGDDNHVVYLAIDGFDSDYLDGRAELPNIRALAEDGSITSGTGVMSSMTNQSWASSVTGAYPEVTLNDAYVLAESGTVQGQTRRNEAETFGEALSEAGKTMLSAQFFMLQDRGVAFGDAEHLYTQPGGDCVERADDIISVVNGEPVDSDGEMVTMSGIPDFMAMYCSDVDGAGHDTGENSPETVAALEHVDEQIGRVVDAFKEAGIYDKTTFIMTGDHGISTYQRVNGQQVEAAIDELGYEAEWVSTGQAPSPGTNVALAGGGQTSIHLVDDLEGDQEAALAIREALLDVEGVGDVFDKEEQQEMRMAPTYGDLIAEPAPGWAMFAEDAPFDRGRHGTTQDMHLTFMVSGYGVIPGAELDDPRLVDVAPTITHLLGVPAPADSQGRVLEEILGETAPEPEPSEDPEPTEEPSQEPDPTPEPDPSSDPDPSPERPDVKLPRTGVDRPTDSARNRR